MAIEDRRSHAAALNESRIGPPLVGLRQLSGDSLACFQMAVVKDTPDGPEMTLSRPMTAIEVRDVLHRSGHAQQDITDMLRGARTAFLTERGGCARKVAPLPKAH